MTAVEFSTVQRQQFRRVFQPSRIVLGIFSADHPSGVNPITLSFNMHSSYKPPMMTFGVFRNAFTRTLLETATECVLAVPGESLADEAMYCGVESGRVADKVAQCGLELIQSEAVSVPGLARAIANIELRIANRVPAGDHLLVIGEVARYAVNKSNRERCLLSLGPDHSGFELLARRGIHRIGAIARSAPERPFIEHG